MKAVGANIKASININQKLVSLPPNSAIGAL